MTPRSLFVTRGFLVQGSAAAATVTYHGRMEIRAARLEDARAMAQVHVESWRSAYAGLLPDSVLAELSIDMREAFWRKILGTAARNAFVATDDGAVVGWVTSGPSRDDDTDAHAMEVYGIYLLQEVWRRGLGRRLWHAAVAVLPPESPIFVWVLEGNDRACRFYEVLGGRLDGATKVEERAGAQLSECRYRFELGC